MPGTLAPAASLISDRNCRQLGCRESAQASPRPGRVVQRSLRSQQLARPEKRACRYCSTGLPKQRPVEYRSVRKSRQYPQRRTAAVAVPLARAFPCVRSGTKPSMPSPETSPCIRRGTAVSTPRTRLPGTLTPQEPGGPGPADGAVRRSHLHRQSEAETDPDLRFSGAVGVGVRTNVGCADGLQPSPICALTWDDAHDLPVSPAILRVRRDRTVTPAAADDRLLRRAPVLNLTVPACRGHGRAPPP